MFDIFLLNLLKLMCKLRPSSYLVSIIDNFYLNKAYKTILKLEKAKKYNYSAKKIKIILLLSGINLKIKDDNFYYKLIDVINVQGNLDKNRSVLTHHLENHNLNSIGFRTWLNLRDIFYLKFEMVLGGICRTNAVRSASINSRFSYNKKDKNRAKLDLILDLKKNKCSKNIMHFENIFDKELINKFLLLTHTVKPLKKNCENQKEEFFKFLYNKNVAIVGPAESNSNDAVEIDAFDIVVRFNYTFSGKNLDQFKKGLKTHISYFNGEQFKYLINKMEGKLPNDLNVACIKDNEFKRKEQLEKINPNKVIKKISNYNSLTFYSSLNLLPIALLDILEANTKSIKIFHSDLFLTTNRSPNYYPSQFNRDGNANIKVMKESFLNHDPLMHHKFLKIIYKKNKIKGDKNFQKVMKMDTEEYLKNLEKLYR